MLVQLHPDAAHFQRGGAFPQYVNRDGTNAPVEYLAFDASADERSYFRFKATDYAAGNVTVDIFWGSETATSGNVVWEVALAATTPSDSESLEAIAFGTADTATSACLGTTAKRLTSATITLSGAELDSLADGDIVELRVSRLGSSGSDTMTGDANLVYLEVSG